MSVTDLCWSFYALGLGVHLILPVKLLTRGCKITSSGTDNSEPPAKVGIAPWTPLQLDGSFPKPWPWPQLINVDVTTAHANQTTAVRVSWLALLSLPPQPTLHDSLTPELS